MFWLGRTELDHPAIVQTLDFNGVRAIVLIDIFCPRHTLPRASQNEIIVAMFNNKNCLLDFDTANVHRNIVANTNRAMLVEFGVSFGVVCIDPPTNLSVDGEACLLEDALGHYIDFRSIVQKGIDRDISIDGNLGTSGRTCVKLFEVSGVGASRGYIRSVGNGGGHSGVERNTTLSGLFINISGYVI